MAELSQYETDYQLFRQRLGDLEGEALALAAEAFKGAPIREEYVREIRAMSQGFESMVEQGRILPRDAAESAFRARTRIRGLKQAKMTDFGRSIAQLVEKERSFAQLWERNLGKVRDAYAKAGRVFDAANPEHLDDVAMEVVRSAGRNRGTITPRSVTAGGVTVFALSLIFIAIDIHQARDKSFAVSKHVVSVAAGAAGFWAGVEIGAAAGTVVGPWGTVIGGVVGGIVGGLLGEEAHARLRGMADPQLDRLVSASTGVFDFDEDRLGREIAKAFGPDLDRTAHAIAELDEKRNADVDEVVLAYVRFVQRHIATTPGGIIHRVLRNRKDVVELLTRCLDEGWTTAAEYAAIRYLRAL
ncbi:MAG: hypothetical protein IPM29_29250 [Planctomycetes bacterium]|nr:hypothetical protein [Planctomycetota bacterium]